MKGLTRRQYNSFICMSIVGVSLWSQCSGVLTSTFSKPSYTISYKIETTTARTRPSLIRPRTSSFKTSTTTWTSRPSKTPSLPHTSSVWLQTSPSLSPDVQTSQLPPETTQKPSSSSKPNTSHSSPVKNAENIIRIVGIVGAVLAAVGLTYVVLKVTKCCMCLRSKDSIDNSHLGSSSRERVRLARAADQDGNIQICANIQETSQPLSPTPINNTAQGTSNEIDETAADIAHDSDTDSLQEMNELPPSYESLYLNELGEPVSPPKYSPPAHRSTHPPRRVNTFN